MSGNIFSLKRFIQLLKQHYIHNNQLYVLSTVAYIGVIIIVLSLTQLGNSLEPHNVEIFQGFLIGFVSVFGILYVGHSFSAFRSKERTINYLMMPGSHLEKFLIEFITKICLTLLVLPLLYWISFHIQGYFFSILTSQHFESVSIEYLMRVDVNAEYFPIALKLMIGAAIMFTLTLAFTGSAMFSKQPLVKTLFSVAAICIFFTGYSYIVLEAFGVGNYRPPKDMYLVPMDEKEVFISFSAILIFSTLVMLFVAYRKLKEKEV